MSFLVASLVASLLLMAFVRWRMRKAQERAYRAMEEGARRQGDDPSNATGGGAVSPFGLFPFGGLFEQMLNQAGMTRSYVYDQETGSWVDVTEQHPDAPPRPDATRPADGSSRAPATPAPSSQRRQQRKAPSSPFGGLFGGLDRMGGGGDFDVRPPQELPRFGDVGGMEELKTEIRDSVALLLKHPDDAARYGIEWNGVLLYGPPGVGKTFFANAIAGEYGMNMIHVSTGDLVSSLQGGSARNIDKAFDTALGALPCVLFFDEFDSVAQRRDQNPDQEARRTVNQLLTALERHRDERRLLVMAATNSLEHIDPAVIRPGRFDRHVRIDLPDADARREIFRTELEDRPVARDIDLEDLVRRTEGMTPATIEKVVDLAAMDVFRESAASGQHLELGEADLLAAIERLGGRDRPTVEHWTWESLILPEPIKAQLQQLQAIIEDPESARRFGVDPPTGLLLAGPPGTGKTTVAKVLAAQAKASFYPISGADVMSKWVGESERNIRQLFERARENRPSIVFIDEIDAIAGRRGDLQIHDSQVNQLLAEIDGIGGQRGIFVIGATNRPDQIDPALLRGGRLSRTIVLGLPGESERLAILRLYTARMPTVAVRFEELARDTDGMSPADLRSLAQEAALAAMGRSGDEASPAVTHDDFTEALGRMRAPSMP
ncbi:MAG TPA: AAA family ATPase [Actinomycetota bacterium]|nr:AAA family ATPase [Actinomycetota bacterium]